MQPEFFRKHSFILAVFLLAVACKPSPLRADRVTLKDGLELEGTIIASPFRVALRSDLKTYYVPTSSLLHPEGEAAEREILEAYAFDVTVPKNAKRLGAIGKIVEVEPFDAFGRRNVTLAGLDGKKIVVTQAIAELHPTHALVQGLNYSWTSALALTEIPPTELDAILERLSPAQSISDQLKRVNFLLEAKRYTAARDLLALLKSKFPDESSRLVVLEEKLRERFCAEGRRVAENALAADQTAKASQIQGEFVKLPSAQGWDELRQRLEETASNIAKGKELMSAALAEVEWKEEESPLRGIAEEILAEVGPASVDRVEGLVAFGDPAKPRDNIALGVSGWLAGKELATREEAKALEMARARAQLLATIAAEDDADFEIALDAARGVSPALAQVLLPRLLAPPIDAKIGEVFQAKVPGKEGASSLVLLPSEYTRAGKHPLIIALRGVSNSAEQELAFWRPVAEELGAVLVVPESLSGENKAYTYSLEEHRRLLAILADARRRFAVDSNRVFLVGHEVGAFAVFDVGMSHPDEWAGIIPISGLPRFYAQYYGRNITKLPIFAVDGHLNGDNPALMRSHAERWFKQQTPMVYVEYHGRGAGSYEVERPVLVDWMRRQRRNPFPNNVEAASARHCDSRFYWIEIDGFMENAIIPPQLFDKKKGVRPARVKGERSESGSLSVQVSGVTSLFVHLSPALVPMDDEDFVLKVNGKQVERGKIEADLATMLREVRRSGDRQRLILKSIRVTP